MLLNCFFPKILWEFCVPVKVWGKEKKEEEEKGAVTTGLQWSIIFKKEKKRNGEYSCYWHAADRKEITQRPCGTYCFMFADVKDLEVSHYLGSGPNYLKIMGIFLLSRAKAFQMPLMEASEQLFKIPLWIFLAIGLQLLFSCKSNCKRIWGKECGGCRLHYLKAGCTFIGSEFCLLLGFFSLAALNNLLKTSHDVMPPRERPIRTWLWNERTTPWCICWQHFSRPQEYLNLLLQIPPVERGVSGKKPVAFPFAVWWLLLIKEVSDLLGWENLKVLSPAAKLQALKAVKLTSELPSIR